MFKWPNYILVRCPYDMTVRSVLSQFEKDPLHFVVKKLSQQASFAFPDGPGTRSSLLSMIVRLQNSRFFFLKISEEIGKACRKSLTRAKRASLPRSRSLFSASFQTFCLTTRAYLNTQKYRLFCSLHDCELMRVNLLAKTKAYIGKLRLSRWKTIEIMKIIRFQSLKVTSTQGIPVSNNKAMGGAGCQNREVKKATTESKPKVVKLVKMSIFHSLKA